MLTCKFGGSSLSCSANFQRAAAILAADSHRRCVVVSAPGRRNPQDAKLTDLLYACQSAAAQGRGGLRIYAPHFEHAYCNPNFRRFQL